MKKSLILLMLSSIMIFAKNTYIVVDKGTEHYGGFIDKVVVFIYPGTNIDKTMDFKNKEKNIIYSVCKSKDTRDLLKEGYKIMYVYPGDKKAAFFLVDNCDNSSKE